ncbi:hypothetical protein C8N46_102205 [Kordia periserrulae]|uniref:Uncharacterized protein n=1 Tax=Kordia periserrulae TaxID=701523 RepID=A0A2T6C3B6_9FLAO|nr:class I lanthipeptide [Kordia periserrulae]PTX62805.1 hypothetical protein C8N46_102205 [Kordia periserrulae]
MKKQKQLNKLTFSKHVIGNLNQVSGGKPPKTYRYCESDVCEPSEGSGGFTSYCSVIAC